MPIPLARRHFLAGSCALSAPFLATTRSTASPSAKILETKWISPQKNYYHGWSTLTQLQNGDLAVAWSGRRVAHVCPFGSVEMMRSRDGGETWDFPRTVHDSLIDDRDAGILETEKGTILVTSFTSLAYIDHSYTRGKWEGDPVWEAAHRRLPDDENRSAELGCWTFRSTDGGATFSNRIDTVVNSPHGPSQLSGGRLLYCGKRLWEDEKRIGVSVSDDDGITWQWLSEIPTREGDEFAAYHELHAVECEDGTIIAQIRNHNETNKGETLQTRSTDGGKTWSVPRSIGVWGLPSHLLKLSDGRLLMSYGYRRRPYGNHVRISEDNGGTWSDPITISSDGAGSDLGYPSTVELGDSSFVTVWYEKPADSEKAQLRQAKWNLP
ncbi:MAG: sialidase family protein [Verrucomicrobiota bacterium]